ncbi:MAG TPA: hypothetical protein VFV87_17815, partial [Pirellulaceae bacterium]|nr:hypothetical protein [Pirellulaceae bacterium]
MYRAVPAQEVARSRRELAAAVRDVEAWLNRSGADRAAGWKRYLHWSELENIVAQEGAPEADSVQTILRKLSASENGLENRRMVRMRQALKAYADVATAAADTRLQETYAQNLDELAKHLEAYQQNPAAGDEALAVAKGLDWLARTGQASDLQSDIREQFGQPNLFASVSERFAAVGVEQNVDQLTGVRDNILGTDIHGTARMTGHTSLAFLDNPRAATFNIFLAGTAVSNNVGYNGPVTVYTSGVTSISASKQIQMTADGLVGYRSGARCATRTNIRDLCANCGLIEKIAWRRAGEQKAEAEAIASSHAASRVAGQLDGETGGLIAEQNANYQRRFKQPLVRRNAFPERLVFSSTSD